MVLSRDIYTSGREMEVKVKDILSIKSEEGICKSNFTFVPDFHFYRVALKHHPLLTAVAFKSLLCCLSRSADHTATADEEKTYTSFSFHNIFQPPTSQITPSPNAEPNPSHPILYTNLNTTSLTRPPLVQLSSPLIHLPLHFSLHNSHHHHPFHHSTYPPHHQPASSRKSPYS